MRNLKREHNSRLFHIHLLVFLIILSNNCINFKKPETEITISTPLGTSLESFGTKNTSEVWKKMIGSAEKSIDLAFFYLVSRKNSLLEPVIEKIIKKAEQGVRIRILTEKKMYGNSKKLIEKFRRSENITLRIFDWKDLTGGILHAKYFIIDGRSAFIGSQNFDWRSLEHIQETGIIIKNKRIVNDLKTIFDLDWEYCGGAKNIYKIKKRGKPDNSKKKIFLTASPPGMNPEGIEDSLTAIVRSLDNAKEKITIQLLSYNNFVWKSKKKFNIIDNALKKAAKRGVRVKMIVSDWNLRKPRIESLKELEKIPGIDIKFIKIPLSEKEGFIPYSRVVHSKVMRIDSDLCMIGTSNWSRDYFTSSRNIELFIRSRKIAKKLDKIFKNIWISRYAESIDPEKTYKPPRIYNP